MDLNRRKFFKVAGAASAVALCPSRKASASTGDAAAVNAERRAVLVDTTKCVGCRGLRGGVRRDQQAARPGHDG